MQQQMGLETNQRRIATLGKRQYFGESALLKQEEDGHRRALKPGEVGHRRTASIKTLMFCEFRLLGLAEFNNIVSEYPGTKANIVQTSQLRTMKANAAKEGKEVWEQTPSFPKGTRSNRV
eukprot:FR742981.1.p2 GENE.FR742981.1~~FR742981.1.p2  ORF type:complete len:120 (+),score=13.33 FR742981.1:2-361(+)